MIPLEIEDLGCGRGPGLVGTKLNLYTIIPYRLAGRSPGEIAEVFRLPYPDLTAAHIELLFRHMDDHNEEVMAVHREIQARIDRGNPPWVEAAFCENWPRMLAKKEALMRARAEAEASRRAEPNPAGSVEPAPAEHPVGG